MVQIGNVELPAIIVDLLRHNNSLENEEDRLVREFRDKCSERVAAIQLEVEMIERLIEEHQNKCAVLEAECEVRNKEIFACDVALSPARNLPLDIIQEIALWCLPEYPSGKTKEAPLSLSQVSSAWRKAVIGLPRAWSKLYLHLALGFQWTSLSRFVEEYLGRAASHPLALHITIHRPNRTKKTPQAQSEMRQFLNWMMFHWNSISNVATLQLSSQFPFDSIMSSHCPVDFSRLMCLEIELFAVEESDWLGGCLWTTRALTRAPLLRRLCIREGMWWGDNPAELSIPWWQLTHLVIDQMINGSDFVDLLEECIELESGSFIIVDSFLARSTPTSFANRASRLHLKRLSITFEKILPTSFQLLRHRLFPSIVELSLRFGNDFRQIEPMQPPFHLDSHLPNLRTLSLHLGDHPESIISFATLLRHNPSLTSLKLDAKLSEAKEIFSTLTISADPASSESNQVLPYLSSLAIKLSRCSTARSAMSRIYLSRNRAKQVVEMISSRVAATQDNTLESCLSSFHLEVNALEKMIDELDKKLNVFRRDGFDCKLERLESYTSLE